MHPQEVERCIRAAVPAPAARLQVAQARSALEAEALAARSPPTAAT
jgi:hypothetical protein